MGSAVVLVVLQTSLLLANRDATSWTFSLIRKRNSLPDQALVATFFRRDDNTELKSVQEQRLLQALHANPFTDLSQCVLEQWNQGYSLPTYCFFWHHTTQVIEPVLTEWNPHLILQCIICVHCIVTLYMPKHSFVMGSSTSLFHPLYAAGGLFLLWLITALIVGFGQGRQNLLEPSTWVSCGMLFLGCVGFIYTQEWKGRDLLWNLVFELQMVGVPLTVLLLGTLGIRSYPEIVIHFILLSVAVNTLWLQNVLRGSALYLAKGLTISLPLTCAYMTSQQLSGWEHITVFMGSISLSPLLIMPVILNGETLEVLHDDDIKEKTHHHYHNALKEHALNKFQMRLGALCTAGALLSTIINMAII